MNDETIFEHDDLEVFSVSADEVDPELVAIFAGSPANETGAYLNPDQVRDLIVALQEWLAKREGMG